MENCTSLESITIPESLITVPEQTFSYCSSLKNVVISQGVKIIENTAFYRCSEITQFEIARSVNKLGLSITNRRTALEKVIYNGTEKQLDFLLGDSDTAIKEVAEINGVYGDFDGDFEISVTDALIMRKHLAGKEINEYVNALTADINNDGLVNAKDQLVIRRLLAA